MKLRELLTELQKLDEKYLDCDIMVDTDGATFIVHMVDLTGIYTLDDEDILGRKVVYLTLDHSVKRHYCGI